MANMENRELSYNGRTIALAPVGKFFRIDGPKMEETLATDEEWHKRYRHLPFPVT